MIPSAKARLAGVLGWPVSHSLSPRLHGYWLQRYDIDGAYLPLGAPPASLERVVRTLVDLGFRGFNATLPHKEPLLALCDEVTPEARRIGAVNTVVIDGDRLQGGNSDAFGFAENLRAGASDWPPESGPAVVLGAGGAARAVIAALQDLGVPEIRLANRTETRAVDLAAALADPERTPIRVLPWAERNEALAGAGLLVNTTALGMAGQPALALALDALPGGALVTDIVYAPLETPLLAAARARGNPVVDGLGMLLHQARPGFEAWFGRAPEVTDDLRTFLLGA
ncbi:MAG: shikimate dehydrogenase [Kiloniellales bacterium]|nr:shikimate dehydrogenase [Kiloniellales bacterium]